MGRAARNRQRRQADDLDFAGPVPGQSALVEPAPALPAGAATVRRVATSVGTSALARVGRLVEQEDGVEALRAVPAAAAALDVLTRQAVALARSQGASWQDVGDVFGFTKQAAHKRFGP